jgi:hypothetical protein
VVGFEPTHHPRSWETPLPTSWLYQIDSCKQQSARSEYTSTYALFVARVLQVLVVCWNLEGCFEYLLIFCDEDPPLPSSWISLNLNISNKVHVMKIHQFLLLFVGESSTAIMLIASLVCTFTTQQPHKGWLWNNRPTKSCDHGCASRTAKLLLFD